MVLYAATEATYVMGGALDIARWRPALAADGVEVVALPWHRRNSFGSMPEALSLAENLALVTRNGDFGG